MSDFEEVKLDDRVFYIIGTAHVSDESVKQVERAIEDIKPDVVAVELCEQRYQALKEEKRWDETEITEVIKTGRVYMFLLQVLLSNFQRRIGSKVGVKPGAEMLKAISLAEEKGIKVALVDRNIGVTLKRAVNTLKFSEKIKLLSGLVEGVFLGEEVNKELIESLKRKDILTEMMEELSREVPSLKRVLVDERDEYIALKLLSTKAEKIIAVVGAGHVEGVKKQLQHLHETREKSMEELEKTEKRDNKLLKYAGYVIPALFLAILVLGFRAEGINSTVELLSLWVLTHSLLSAFGSALMLAHPLTILVAFVTAPFTPFHPLSVGMLASLTEVSLRKPRVMDFTELMSIGSLGGYYRNRVARIFLIMLVTDLCNNIGSVLSVIISYTHSFM